MTTAYSLFEDGVGVAQARRALSWVDVCRPLVSWWLLYYAVLPVLLRMTYILLHALLQIHASFLVIDGVEPIQAEPPLMKLRSYPSDMFVVNPRFIKVRSQIYFPSDNSSISNSNFRFYIFMTFSAADLPRKEGPDKPQQSFQTSDVPEAAMHCYCGRRCSDQSFTLSLRRCQVFLPFFSHTEGISVWRPSEFFLGIDLYLDGLSLISSVRAIEHWQNWLRRCRLNLHAQ